MNTSDYIKEIMMKHNLSQTELAKRLDVSQKAISNWVNNVDTPNAASLIAIYTQFKITPNEILGIEKLQSEYELPKLIKNKELEFFAEYSNVIEDNNFQNIAKLCNNITPELRAVVLGYIIGLLQSQGVNTQKILGY